jgi:hypothetical protein
MELPVFEQIASSLTVRAICNPLGPDLPIDADDQTLNEIYNDNTDVDFDAPSRVIDSNGSVVGTVSKRDLTHAAYEEEQKWKEENEEEDDTWMPELGPSPGEIMQPLNPNQFVSSSTTVLDAVTCFMSAI